MTSASRKKGKTTLWRRNQILSGERADWNRTSQHCDAEMRVLSFLLDPPVIRRILAHLDRKATAEARDPPLLQRLAS